MNEREYLISLYDIYGELFKEEQQNIFEDYYFEDKSLSEISENYSKSRNAIHKCIKNINSKLLLYEKKLKINEKNTLILKLIATIEDKNIKKKLEDIYEK